MRPRVLVVDNDIDLANAVAAQLRADGFEPKILRSGAEAIERSILGAPPHALVLEVVMPDISGLEVCRRLRREDRTRELPIVLCSTRGHEVDRVVGLEVGADDYLVKPYSLRELSLRVRNLIRRTQFHPDENEYRIGPVSIDLATRVVTVSGRQVNLSVLEHRLLSYFIDCAGRVISRKQLIRDVWDDKLESVRTVDTHVKRLRDKLGEEFGEYLETVLGVGYRLRGEPPVTVRSTDPDKP